MSPVIPHYVLLHVYVLYLGMLLEMDTDTLVKLLDDQPTLLKKIDQAAVVCNSSTH